MSKSSFNHFFLCEKHSVQDKIVCLKITATSINDVHWKKADLVKRIPFYPTYR